MMMTMMNNNDDAGQNQPFNGISQSTVVPLPGHLVFISAMKIHVRTKTGVIVMSDSEKRIGLGLPAGTSRYWIRDPRKKIPDTG